MEVRDKNLEFANELPITDSQISTVLDGGKLKDFGRGQPVYLNIYLTTAFTSAANSLTIQLVSATGVDPDDGDVFMDVMPARLASVMQTPGLLMRVAWPQDVPGERVGLWFKVSAALAVGKITAFLSLGAASDVQTTT